MPVRPQTPPLRVKMRTLPWFETGVEPTSSYTAPMASVSPESDTEKPKWSPLAASNAVSVCCNVHVPPVRTNTRTLPACERASTASVGEPTASVSPESDTEKPNASFTAPSKATTVASSGQRSLSVCACAVETDATGARRPSTRARVCGCMVRDSAEGARVSPKLKGST